MTLAEQVASLRRTLHRLITRNLVHKTARSFLELRALKAIEAEGLHTQVALSDRLLVDTAAVSRMVARLEHDGLLERQPGEDRRCVHLILTAAGRQEVNLLRAELLLLEAQAHRHLSDQEVETLSRLLAKLHAGLLATPEPEEHRGSRRSET